MADVADMVHDFGSVSFVTPFGYQGGSCGYCKHPTSSQRTPNSRNSYYANTSLLTVDHYQKLVDRGWRRSGQLLYKPDLRRSCCPHYTIRLPAAELQISKSQRQALNRWNTFVLGEDYIKEHAKLHPKSKAEKAQQRNKFDLLTAIHASETTTLPNTPTPAHTFTVTLEPASFTPEKHALYQHYQQTIHHDPASKTTATSFRRFLCTSPLPQSTTPSGQKLGTYHQLYRLDDRLIAFSVLDLLPHAVSGVYFIYHSDFEAYSFGKLSALREESLALEGGYGWYYMGYYIHECVKMRYKAEFRPQFVLDPESYGWDELNEWFKGRLDGNKYVSISRDRRREPGENWEGEGGEDVAERPDVADDAEDEYRLHKPEDAASSNLSLFDLRMPGVLTLAALTDSMDLGELPISIGKNKTNVALLNQLVGWKEGSFTDKHSIKGVVAELAACVGLDVAREMIVEMGG